ncbi:DUF58 domain-containing protein [Desulfobacter latus]|uniref:DUF58 domain-containing protein n=1 Tax=Desulfobacter latus TaxID=2292 RepID=A0A850T1Y6_9BACT|nr:DUF58 domain-containing protein [Desulfobacter latus]NWH05723.1 DUF58 domain-containing protein [Desulfobacter latus]
MKLNRSHLSLRPTQHGIIFIAILIAMFLGSINYNNNAGFILVFLLGTMALISLFHSYKNLVGLDVVQSHVEPVFIGETLVFSFRIKSLKSVKIEQGQALFAQFDGTTSASFLSGTSMRRADLEMKAKTRGILNPGDLTLFSTYPFGLFRLTARIPVKTQGLVYPRPIAGPIPTSLAGGREHGEKSDGRGGPDDFQGLAPYVPGNPMGRISWKTYSRGLGIFIKNFTAETGGEILLDMDLIKSSGVEEKLSLLCRAVLDAEKENLRYGLRLANGVNITFDNGRPHCHKCLKALALYGSQGEGPWA